MDFVKENSPKCTDELGGRLKCQRKHLQNDPLSKIRCAKEAKTPQNNEQHLFHKKEKERHFLSQMKKKERDFLSQMKKKQPPQMQSPQGQKHSMINVKHVPQHNIRDEHVVAKEEFTAEINHNVEQRGLYELQVQPTRKYKWHGSYIHGRRQSPDGKTNMLNDTGALRRMKGDMSSDCITAVRCNDTGPGISFTQEERERQALRRINYLNRKLKTQESCSTKCQDVEKYHIQNRPRTARTLGGDNVNVEGKSLLEPEPPSWSYEMYPRSDHSQASLSGLKSYIESSRRANFNEEESVRGLTSPVSEQASPGDYIASYVQGRLRSCPSVQICSHEGGVYTADNEPKEEKKSRRHRRSSKRRQGNKISNRKRRKSESHRDTNDGYMKHEEHQVCKPEEEEQYTSPQIMNLSRESSTNRETSAEAHREPSRLTSDNIKKKSSDVVKETRSNSSRRQESPHCRSQPATSIAAAIVESGLAMGKGDSGRRQLASPKLHLSKASPKKTPNLKVAKKAPATKQTILQSQNAMLAIGSGFDMYDDGMFEEEGDVDDENINKAENHGETIVDEESAETASDITSVVKKNSSPNCQALEGTGQKEIRHFGKYNWGEFEEDGEDDESDEDIGVPVGRVTPKVSKTKQSAANGDRLVLTSSDTNLPTQTMCEKDDQAYIMKQTPNRGEVPGATTDDNSVSHLNKTQNNEPRDKSELSSTFSDVIKKHSSQDRKNSRLKDKQNGTETAKSSSVNNSKNKLSSDSSPNRKSEQRDMGGSPVRPEALKTKQRLPTFKGNSANQTRTASTKPLNETHQTSPGPAVQQSESGEGIEIPVDSGRTMSIVLEMRDNAGGTERTPVLTIRPSSPRRRVKESGPKRSPSWVKEKKKSPRNNKRKGYASKVSKNRSPECEPATTQNPEDSNKQLITNDIDPNDHAVPNCAAKEKQNVLDSQGTNASKINNKLEPTLSGDSPSNDSTKNASESSKRKKDDFDKIPLKSQGKQSKHSTDNQSRQRSNLHRPNKLADHAKEGNWNRFVAAPVSQDGSKSPNISIQDGTLVMDQPSLDLANGGPSCYEQHSQCQFSRYRPCVHEELQHVDVPEDLITQTLESVVPQTSRPKKSAKPRNIDYRYGSKAQQQKVKHSPCVYDRYKPCQHEECMGPGPNVSLLAHATNTEETKKDTCRFSPFVPCFHEEPIVKINKAFGPRASVVLDKKKGRVPEMMKSAPEKSGKKEKLQSLKETDDVAKTMQGTNSEMVKTLNKSDAQVKNTSKDDSARPKRGRNTTKKSTNFSEQVESPGAASTSGIIVGAGEGVRASKKRTSDAHNNVPNEEEPEEAQTGGLSFMSRISRAWFSSTRAQVARMTPQHTGILPASVKNDISLTDSLQPEKEVCDAASAPVEDRTHFTTGDGDKSRSFDQSKNFDKFEKHRCFLSKSRKQADTDDTDDNNSQFNRHAPSQNQHWHKKGFNKFKKETSPKDNDHPVRGINSNRKCNSYCGETHKNQCHVLEQQTSQRQGQYRFQRDQPIDHSQQNHPKFTNNVIGVAKKPRHHAADNTVNDVSQIGTQSETIHDVNTSQVSELQHTQSDWTTSQSKNYRRADSKIENRPEQSLNYCSSADEHPVARKLLNGVNSAPEDFLVLTSNRCSVASDNSVRPMQMGGATAEVLSADPLTVHFSDVAKAVRSPGGLSKQLLEERRKNLYGGRAGITLCDNITTNNKIYTNDPISFGKQPYVSTTSFEFYEDLQNGGSPTDFEKDWYDGEPGETYNTRGDVCADPITHYNTCRENQRAKVKDSPFAHTHFVNKRLSYNIDNCASTIRIGCTDDDLLLHRRSTASEENGQYPYSRLHGDPDSPQDITPHKDGRKATEDLVVVNSELASYRSLLDTIQRHAHVELEKAPKRRHQENEHSNVCVGERCSFTDSSECCSEDDEYDVWDEEDSESDLCSDDGSNDGSDDGSDDDDDAHDVSAAASLENCSEDDRGEDAIDDDCADDDAEDFSQNQEEARGDGCNDDVTNQLDECVFGDGSCHSNVFVNQESEGDEEDISSSESAESSTDDEQEDDLDSEIDDDSLDE